MIFVTVGTNEAPFDRLVRAVERLAGRREVLVQYGASSVRPAGATLVEFLPFDDLVQHIRSAEAVVTHAGVGSVLVALEQGRAPIVMPRMHRYGEAVDDHQVMFAERLAAAGLLRIVVNADELEVAVAETTGLREERGRAAAQLSGELRRFLLEHSRERRTAIAR